MATLQEVRTFTEMYTFCLKRLKLPTDVTDLTNRVKQAINIAYGTFMRLENWDFGQRVDWITTTADYSTGTANVTNDSATVTMSTDGSASYSVGDYMRIGGDPTIYEIKTVSTVTITLETVFRGTTASAATFRTYTPRYALAADFGEPVNFKEFFRDTSLRPLGIREISSRLSLDPPVGKPAFYALTWEDATTALPVPSLLLYPPADDIYILPYNYKINVTLLKEDTDEPILPDQERIVLCWMALSDLFLYVKDDPQGAQMAGGQAGTLISKLAGTYSPTKDRPAFRPDLSRYKRAVGSKRISTGKYHLGQDLFGRIT